MYIYTVEEQVIRNWMGGGNTVQKNIFLIFGNTQDEKNIIL